MTLVGCDAIICLMDLKYAEIVQKGFGKPERIYLFHGPEDAPKRKAAEALAAEFVDGNTLDFNVEMADGAECTADRLMSAASTAPMGEKNRRIVVVNYANTMPSDQQDRLAERLGGIPDNATLIFIEPKPEPSASDPKQPKKGSRIGLKLRNAIGKIGVKVEFPPLKADAAKAEAQRVFQQHGRKATPAVLEALVRRVGEDVGVLNSEIEKVAHYTGDRLEVTVEDVMTATSATPEERIWALVDAIGSRNTSAALRALEDVLDSAGDLRGGGPRILGMIGRQLRLIWQMRLLLDAGVGNPLTQQIPESLAAMLPSDPNVVSVLRSQKWNLGRFRAQAQKFRPGDLVAAFDRVLQADLALKGMGGGPQDPRMVLELLTVDLCQGTSEV